VIQIHLFHFFFFLLLVFLCYTLTIVPSRPSLIDRCYGIVHTGWSRSNTQLGICPVVPEKHVKTVDRLQSQTIMYLPNARAYGNVYKYETRQCSHTSRIHLDLARTYKLQVTSHRPRPISYSDYINTFIPVRNKNKKPKKTKQEVFYIFNIFNKSC
jgi:hypothetical protein